MSPRDIAELLTTAEAIQAIGFYVMKSENRPAELGCRIWKTDALSHEQARVLADELNAAVKTVTDRLAYTLLNKAANQLRAHL